MTEAEKIKVLNDNFRTNLFRRQPHNHLMLSRYVSVQDHETITNILKMVKDFNNFNEDNDPYGEHDFGKIDYHGETYFFKIDYYASDMRHGSEDPANENITERVLTVMRADEY